MAALAMRTSADDVAPAFERNESTFIFLACKKTSQFRHNYSIEIEYSRLALSITCALNAFS